MIVLLKHLTTMNNCEFEIPGSLLRGYCHVPLIFQLDHLQTTTSPQGFYHTMSDHSPVTLTLDASGPDDG